MGSTRVLDENGFGGRTIVIRERVSPRKLKKWTVGRRCSKRPSTTRTGTFRQRFVYAGVGGSVRNGLPKTFWVKREKKRGVFGKKPVSNSDVPAGEDPPAVVRNCSVRRTGRPARTSRAGTTPCSGRRRRPGTGRPPAGSSAGARCRPDSATSRPLRTDGRRCPPGSPGTARPGRNRCRARPCRTPRAARPGRTRAAVRPPGTGSAAVRHETQPSKS